MTDRNFPFKIIIPGTADELEKYYKLRYEVLRKAWGQEEKTVKDEWEDISLHVMMIDTSGNAIATGRLQYNSTTEGQIRSMAVHENYRSKGLGTEILKFLEQHAKEKRLGKIVLDARDKAVNFYRKNGYVIEGNSYLLFGEIQHYRMSKNFK
jgi:predicted GNAT family N-acyltransferase